MLSKRTGHSKAASMKPGRFILSPSTPRPFTWSLHWQILTATVLVMSLTLLLSALVDRNVSMTALDQEIGAHLKLVAQLAQHTLPLKRLNAYTPGDEATAVFQRDLATLTVFCKAMGLDRLTVLTPSGQVVMDTSGLKPGAYSGFETYFSQPGGMTLIRLHRAPQGHLQKILFTRLAQAQVLRLVAGAKMFSALERAQWRKTITFIMGMGLTAALSWWIAFLLSRKTAHLSRAFNRMQAGEQNIQVDVRGSDEMAYLSRAFNDMARELNVKTEAERAQHEKRIAELQVLSAGIAHEVRNPLGAISALVDLLNRNSDLASGESRDLVNRIRAEIDRMNKLVIEVMEYARQARPRCEHLPLQTLREQMLDIDPQLEVILAAPNPGQVWADAKGLNTALRNLLLNARRAAGPKGQVSLEIRQERAGLAFCVRDSGPGVPLKIAENIFQPFFTHQSPGTGLGLAIARNIIEAHGGSLILVPSEHGACFIATLPQEEKA